MPAYCRASRMAGQHHDISSSITRHATALPLLQQFTYWGSERPPLHEM